MKLRSCDSWESLRWKHLRSHSKAYIWLRVYSAPSFLMVPTCCTLIPKVTASLDARILTCSSQNLWPWDTHHCSPWCSKTDKIQCKKTVHKANCAHGKELLLESEIMCTSLSWCPLFYTTLISNSRFGLIFVCMLIILLDKINFQTLRQSQHFFLPQRKSQKDFASPVKCLTVNEMSLLCTVIFQR